MVSLRMTPEVVLWPSHTHVQHKYAHVWTCTHNEHAHIQTYTHMRTWAHICFKFLIGEGHGDRTIGKLLVFDIWLIQVTFFCKDVCQLKLAHLEELVVIFIPGLSKVG